jgi:uncharacterized protein
MNIEYGRENRLRQEEQATAGRTGKEGGNAPAAEEAPMNIDYPFHFDTRGRTASTGEDDHVRDMIEQLLFTNPGERVNRPDFGSGLLQLIFAPNSPELAAALQFTVQAALQQWLGDVIQVQALEVSSEDSKLQVELKYLVLSTAEQRTDVFVRGGV